MLLLDCHDSLDLALALLHSPLHLVEVAAHLPNQVLIVRLLADDGAVAALLHIAVNFEAVLLVKLFEFQTEAILLTAEEFLELVQICGTLDLGKDALFDFADLPVDRVEELGDGGFESLRDDLGSDLVHVLQTGFVGGKFLIEKVLQVAGDV